MRVCWLFLLVMLVSVTTVHAESFIVLDAVSYQSGDTITFRLKTNGSQASERLNCRLEAGQSILQVDAFAAEGPVSNDVSYRLTLPPGLSGPVELTLDDVDTAPVMFLVKVREEGEAESYPTMSSLYNLAQPYIDNISAYKPIYFLVGTDPEKSKFQFSFKYRLFNPQGSLNKNLPWLQGIHLAYTQTAFWDLKSDSTPFQDTSYKPEVFFLTPNVGFRPGGMDGLFFQFGYQHESNGREGVDSRSTNFLYLETFFAFYNETSRYGLGIAPKVWMYVNNDNETNPDLSAYRGYFSLEAKAGKADGLVFGADLRWAKEGGSIQADLTYPIHQFLGNNLELYLQLQYVNALAESLINYQDRTEAVRIGIAIVR